MLTRNTTARIGGGAAVAAVLLFAAPLAAHADDAPVPAPTPTDTHETVTLHWLTPNTGDVAPTAETVGWPQSVVDPTACGTGWVQNDVNRYGTPAEKASVDAQSADGVLTKGEDYGTVVSWTFTRQVACAVTPPVEPPVVVPPVVTPVPAAAPVAPVADTQLPTLAFTGPTEAAERLRAELTPIGLGLLAVGLLFVGGTWIASSVRLRRDGKSEVAK